MPNQKGKLSPEAQQILDLILRDIENDLRDIVFDMSEEELAAFIEDERREATDEQFASFMSLVNEVRRKKCQ